MNEDIKESLVKYITGQSDETEAAEVKEWIRASPENEKFYVQLYEAWHQSLIAGASIDVDEAFSAIAVKTIYRKPLIRKLSFWMRLAAAVVLLPACVLTFYKFGILKEKDQTLNVVKVPKGLPRKISLPDGTVVWVNAGSEIRYSKVFGKQDRTIYLDGEAYFDIAETNTNIPFLVKTGKFTIRDIGTVFNVKSYADEDVFETTVVEGQVSVEGPLTEQSTENSKVLLDANQVLKISNKKAAVQQEAQQPEIEAAADEPLKVIQIRASEVEEFNGWKNDLLVFQDDSFDEMSRVLERRYDVEIDITSERLRNYKYTGTFKNVEEILTVLKVIKETTPITYTFTDKRITISENK